MLHQQKHCPRKALNITELKKLSHKGAKYRRAKKCPIKVLNLVQLYAKSGRTISILRTMTMMTKMKKTS